MQASLRLPKAGKTSGSSCPLLRLAALSLCVLFVRAEPALRNTTGTQLRFGAFFYLLRLACTPTAYSRFYATSLPEKDKSKHETHEQRSAKRFSRPTTKTTTILNKSSPHHTAEFGDEYLQMIPLN